MSGVRAFLVTFALTLFVDIKSESVCEEKYSKKQFVITSKNYPDAYPANFSCRYLIYGDVCPRKYNLQFLDFELEEDEECSKDYLKVGEEEKLCGSKSGVKTYFAPEGSLVLNFVTNEGISGKGFEVLVTKLPCETVQQKQNFYNFFDWKQALGWNYRPAAQTTTFCCKQAYNAKHFFLASPGFPYSHNHPNDCVYHIYKNNQNICRLRINVVYFLHGSMDESCSGSFLEIDGKKLCGCQNDLKLVVPFDPYSNFPKALRFKNDGFHKSEYSGFALEVIQDECPRKYLSQRLQKRSTIEKAKLQFENLQREPHQQQVVKHVYFFSDPQEVNYEDYFPDVIKPKDREEADYVDTSDMNFQLNGNEAQKCAGFNFEQLTQNDLWNKASQCKTSEAEPRDCKELSAAKGYFYSPGYPYYYPPNLNLCYRFKRHAGYCGIKLFLVDFHIEYSNDCTKDYLLLGGKFRYCGQQLHNTVSTLDLSKKDYEDVTFVTDSYYCNKGFKAVYEQIPCTYGHTTTLAPPTTQAPILPCNSLINEQDFTLNIFASHQDTCIFTVYKSNTEVCRLELQSLVSNLDCNSEDVFIKGRSLCSLTESESFSVDYKDDDSIPIVYKRLVTHAGASGLRVQLNGKQRSENCFYNIPEVPAEKLETASSDYGLFLVLNSAIKDFCGIISSTTFAESPQDSCKILMETNMVKTCIPAKTNATELPIDAEQLEMYLSPKSRETKVAVQKVDCSYLIA